MQKRDQIDDQVTVLEVWDTREGFTFRALEPGKFLDPAGPVAIESAVRVNQETLKSLCSRLEHFAQTPRAPVEDFQACGRALFDQLIAPLDEDFKAKLASLTTSLLISSRESNIVWELLHDGEEFWGLKYLLGRQIRAGVQPPVLPVKEAPSRCLVVANPSGDEELRAAEEQAQALVGHLESLGIECRYLGRDQATPAHVLVELSSGSCDIFYFIGHVARVDEARNCVREKDPGDYALQLAGGWLRSFEIERAARGVSMVFLNGCQSARSVESLTNAFLRKGAILVMGTVFKVSSYGARVFAEKFYEYALKGEQVGEAFRLARKAVYADPRCGNAWSCFVMYGNPCLRIIGPVLPPALRKPFDDSCRCVIEECLCYSQAFGVVCSPFLFAAMLGGEDAALREWLQAQGISTEKLRGIFEAAREEDKVDVSDRASLEVSKSVVEIIDLAGEEARKNGRESISESDLLTGFIRQGGGSMGRFLADAGIDLAAIAGNLPKEKMLHFGSLRRRDCTDEAWALLKQAVLIACYYRSRVVGSPHLFLAFLQNPPEELARFLEMQGASLSHLTASLERTIGASSGRLIPLTARISPSASVSEALKLAAEVARAARHEKITPSDLLRGFVQQGGGKTGELFSRQAGIELGVMFSQLFTRQGELDDEKFGVCAGKVLATAREYAIRMGWKGIATPHLILALCSPDDSLTSALVREQGFDPEKVKIIIRERFGLAEDGVMGEVPLRISTISARFQRILLRAENLAKAEGCEHLTERHLLLGFLGDGGGETGEILRSLGLNLARLKEQAEACE